MTQKSCAVGMRNAILRNHLKKYLDPENHGKRKLFLDWQLQHYGGPVVYRGNLYRYDLSKFVNTTDAFTTEILQLWSEISYEANVNSTDHFLSLPLWHNFLIRIDPCITNRGAVKVSRTLQTFLKTRIPFYLLMNFRNDTTLKQIF